MILMYSKINRRRASALTNYDKRLALLKSGLTRLVVRKTNRSIIAQLVGYKKDGDYIIASANSSELKKFEWMPHSNIPTAYLTGALLAKKAKDKNVGEAVLDIGVYKPVKYNVIFAAAKGCKDNGLKLKENIEFDEDRLNGKHISEYAKKDKENKVQFSGYAKAKFDVSKLDEIFDSVKKKIINE